MIRLMRVDAFMDSGFLQDLSRQIRTFPHDDFEKFFEMLPPITDLIVAIPRSLAVLDAIYTKCDTFEDPFNEIFRRHLESDQLLNRVLWWLAQNNRNPVDIASRYVKKDTSQPFSVAKTHLHSLLCVMHKRIPDVIEEIFMERNQLSECLEALGCHGTVNSNLGMITLIDATLCEAGKLKSRLKTVFLRLKEMQKQKLQFLDESVTKGSHQRQVNLRLSEVFERLKQNEVMERALQEILSSANLLSLLRIVRKRVKADRALINVYNSYNNTKPVGFQICDINPIVVKFVVMFKAAYDQLTSLIPSSFDTDSGIAQESGEKTGTASSDEECGIDEFLPLKKSASKGSMALYSRIHLDRRGEAPTDVDCFTVDRTSDGTNTFSDDARWITLSIYSSEREVEAVLCRFADLYHGQKKEVLCALNDLDEFRGKQALQLKTMMSAAVLTYRSAYDNAQMQYNKVYEVLELAASDLVMDMSIYRTIYRKAKSDCGMHNAKEVTTQIWETLFDFPSLKTCTRFNRFVLDCVDVVWDLVAGVDGRLPRLRIEYDTGQDLDDRMHVRAEGSSRSSDIVQACLWPGLVSVHDNKCMFKALVLT